MNKQNRMLLMVALLLIGGTAVGMSRLKANQKLGAPGVKATVIAGSQRMELYLPEFVLDYDSVLIPTDEGVLRGLPQDTSFMQRQYRRPGDPEPRYWRPGEPFALDLNVVLMGTDRTSIHKPQFCMRGSGWDIDSDNSTNDVIRVERPHPYDLPVMKMLNTREVKNTQGEAVKIRGIYVYWFVADHDLTADHWTRMRKMATHLLRTGELERWAYVSCLGVCLPGQEDETYERMKKFIAAAVPEFQLAAGESAANPAAIETASR